MSSERAGLARVIEELARYVVAFEAALEEPSGGSSNGGVDTPALGVLLSLELFGPLRPSALSQLLAMNSGTTTKRIDRLERAGMVARRGDPVPGDRRGVVVEIQEVGRREIARIEGVAVAMGDELRHALRPLVAAVSGVDEVSAPPGPAPVLAGLFRLVSLIDQTIIRGIGRHHVLHPADPRPILLLADLDRNGPRAPGAVPELIDRSRTSAHRLVQRMSEEGLVASGRAPGVAQRALVRVTPKGRRVLRSVAAALADDIATVRPATAELLAGLDASVGDAVPPLTPSSGGRG